MPQRHLDRERTLSRYDDVLARLDGEQNEREVLETVAIWERLRREVDSWKAEATLEFRQNTANESAIENSRRSGELSPVFEGRDVEIKKRLLTSPRRGVVEEFVGSFTVARWEAEIAAFAPAILADLELEAELARTYTGLIGRSQASVRGKDYSLTGLAAFGEEPDRSLRREACEAGWRIVEENATVFDQTFDDLVRCRTSMARKLGYQSHIEPAYMRMGRVGYGPAEVARFRDEIRDCVTPLAAAFAGRQAEALGLEQLLPWDEQLYDLLPRPQPQPSIEALCDGLVSLGSSMHESIGELFTLLVRQELLDVDARPGKRGGAYCTFFSDIGLPFVFANYNGSSQSAISLLHEAGHAFQNYESRAHPALEHMLPTSEIGEIHAISLEFLAGPLYDHLFASGGERYRAANLGSRISSLSYIAAIDHFQELAYAHPYASPTERCDMWLEMEARYLPWKHRGDIPALQQGRRWQRQLHVYLYPFYYIDYGIAICCALQLWSESLDDHRAAVEKYVRLCRLGGTHSLESLLEQASLRSPFERGTLSKLCEQASTL